MPDSLMRYSCPHCGGRLSIKDAGAIGKKIKCPKCQKPFVVEAPDEEEDEAPRKASRKAAVPEDDDRIRKKARSRDYEDEDDADLEEKSARKKKKKKDEDFDDEDDDRPKKKKKKKAGGFPWILVGVGGVGLAAVVAVVLILVLNKGSTPGGKGGGGGKAAVMPPPKFPDKLIKAAVVQIPLESGYAPKELYFSSAATNQVLVYSTLVFQGVREVQGNEARLDRYDLKSGEKLSSIVTRPLVGLKDASLSPDGTHWARATDAFGTNVSLWSLTQNKEIIAKFDPEVAPGKFGNPALTRIVLLDNERLLTLEGNGTRTLWNLNPRKKIYRVEAKAEDPALKSHRREAKLAVSPDRKLLALHRDGGFDVIDTETGKEVGYLADTAAPGGFADVWGVTFRAGGQELMAHVDALLEKGNVFKRETHVLVWDVKKGALKTTAKVPLRAGIQGKLAGWGNDHALLLGTLSMEGLLVDLKKGEYVRHLRFGGLISCAHAGLDGRLWYAARHQNSDPVIYLTCLDPPQAKDFQTASALQNTQVAGWFLTPDGIEKEPRP